MRWYKRIFTGRYGVKRLSVVLFVIAGLLLLWSFIMPVYWRRSMPLLGAFVFFALGLWRCLSRNIGRRLQEERAFDMLWARFRMLGQRTTQGFPSRGKDSRFIVVRCPRCRQKLRVPRGKGLIRITCKRCTGKFERKV